MLPKYNCSSSQTATDKAKLSFTSRFAAQVIGISCSTSTCFDLGNISDEHYHSVAQADGPEARQEVSTRYGCITQVEKRELLCSKLQ